MPASLPSRKPDAGATTDSPFAQLLLQDLRAKSVVLAEDWEKLPDAVHGEILHCGDVQRLLQLLLFHNLLTPYQAKRIREGNPYGLVLGNYRVLDTIGAGGMGVVYKGEHIRLRQLVAIKVLPPSVGGDEASKLLLMRFYGEVRAIAKMNHPNIVRALDVGDAVTGDPRSPHVHYYVMEYVEGQNLEDHVRARGPLPPQEACALACQVAAALDEAHRHHLVHRDIKPSNVLITGETQAKLLDFGLARHFHHRLTEPGTVLGTIDYMAPEQAQDAATVDIRADIYGLGGTLFYCLTGRPPFAVQDHVARQLMLRQTQKPPSLRSFAPNVPVELEALVHRMMAARPEDRFATPQAVTKALLPFARSTVMDLLLAPAVRSAAEISLQSTPAPSARTPPTPVTAPAHVLVVDDEANIRKLCVHILQREGHLCQEAASGDEALAALTKQSFDLLVVDCVMPKMNGQELCRRIREIPARPDSHPRIIMLSGHISPDELAHMMLNGADDYLTKPFTSVQLAARVKATLRQKASQDRMDLLYRQLLILNRELEQNLAMRDHDMNSIRNALVQGLAKTVIDRGAETEAHLDRMRRYVRRLAEEAATLPTLANALDPSLIQRLEECAPLHDLGKVSLPDHILLKPGKLTDEERLLMQSHTILGAETLQGMAQKHPPLESFLRLAAEMARYHHEHFDGTGYPDGKQGEQIPLAARILAFGDVYDALRSRRSYKPALSHSAALQVILQNSPGHFDPALTTAFQHCAPHFEHIFQEFRD